MGCVDDSQFFGKHVVALICDCHNFCVFVLFRLSVTFPHAPSAKVDRVGMLQLVEMPTWIVWIPHNFSQNTFSSSSVTVTTDLIMSLSRVDDSHFFGNHVLSLVCDTYRQLDHGLVVCGYLTPFQ